MPASRTLTARGVLLELDRVPEGYCPGLVAPTGGPPISTGAVVLTLAGEHTFRSPCLILRHSVAQGRVRPHVPRGAPRQRARERDRHDGPRPRRHAGEPRSRGYGHQGQRQRDAGLGRRERGRLRCPGPDKLRRPLHRRGAPVRLRRERMPRAPRGDRARPGRPIDGVAGRGCAATPRSASPRGGPRNQRRGHGSPPQRRDLRQLRAEGARAGSARWGRRPVALAAVVAEFAGLLAFAFSRSLRAILATGILWILPRAAFNISTTAWEKDLFPEENRGQFQGYEISFRVALTMVPGPLIGGWLASRWGIPTVLDGKPGFIPTPLIFQVTAFGTLLALVPLLRAGEERMART